MGDTVTNGKSVLAIPAAEARQLRWLLLLCSVLLGIGLVTPMLTISQFIFIRNSFSVISGVYELFRNGQYLLFLVVAGFSIALPLLKLLVLFRLVHPASDSGAATQRYLRLMHEYGRWAMLDVLVVAILVVTVKLGGIASVEVHYGLYTFGAAVLLIMFVTNRVVRLTDACCEDPQAD